MQINIIDYPTLHLDTKASTRTTLLFAVTVAAPILQLSGNHYLCRLTLPLARHLFVSMFWEQVLSKIINSY